MAKKRTVHKDLSGAQPFPHGETRVMRTSKSVPHIKSHKHKHAKTSKHINSFVSTKAATVPKGSRRKSSGK
jgi:hypothetical protein